MKNLKKKTHTHTSIVGVSHKNILHAYLKMQTTTAQCQCRCCCCMFTFLLWIPLLHFFFFLSSLVVLFDLIWFMPWVHVPLDGNYDESDDSQSLASFFLSVSIAFWLVHIVSRHLRVQFFFLDDSAPLSSSFSLGYEIIRTHCCSVRFVRFGSVRVRCWFSLFFSVQLLVFCSYCGFTFAKKIQLRWCANFFRSAFDSHHLLLLLA